MTESLSWSLHVDGWSLAEVMGLGDLEYDNWMIDINQLHRDAAQLPWRHFVFGSPNARFSLFEWPAGTVYSPHVHEDADEFYVVLSGSAMFTRGSDGQEHQAGRGTVLVFPRGTAHGVNVQGPESVVIFAAVTPNDDETVGSQLDSA